MFLSDPQKGPYLCLSDRISGYFWGPLEKKKVDSQIAKHKVYFAIWLFSGPHTHTQNPTTSQLTFCHTINCLKSLLALCFQLCSLKIMLLGTCHTFRRGKQEEAGLWGKLTAYSLPLAGAETNCCCCCLWHHSQSKIEKIQNFHFFTFSTLALYWRKQAVGTNQIESQGEQKQICTNTSCPWSTSAVALTESMFLDPVWKWDHTKSWEYVVHMTPSRSS